MAENDAPERIWLTPQFADAATTIGGGIYHANLSERDREGCIEYVRANAARDAAQWRQFAQEALADSRDCDECNAPAVWERADDPETYWYACDKHTGTGIGWRELKTVRLALKLVTASQSQPDAVRQARRETWLEAIATLNAIDRRERVTDWIREGQDISYREGIDNSISALEAAALRAEAQNGK